MLSIFSFRSTLSFFKRVTSLLASSRQILSWSSLPPICRLKPTSVQPEQFCHQPSSVQQPDLDPSLPEPGSVFLKRNDAEFRRSRMKLKSKINQSTNLSYHWSHP